MDTEMLVRIAATIDDLSSHILCFSFEKLDERNCIIVAMVRRLAARGFIWLIEPGKSTGQ